jgi:hypothetical protein
MYECDTIGCPNMVSHPGQYCLECEQRQDSEAEEDLVEEMENGSSML